MASAAAPRHGRAPDHPVRPVIATPLIATPVADPDGPVSVGSLLRREGRRAAHALDRPLVPRARDLGDSDGRSTHGVAVAAGTLLAITAVLGSNALGDPALLSGVGIDDTADSGPVTTPAPDRNRTQPSSPAAEVSVGQAVAALQEAGDPVRALLADGLGGSGGGLVPDAVSGAGIVAAALGAPAPGGAVAASDDDDTRDDSSDSDASDDDNSGDTDDRSSSSRTDDGSDRDRGTDDDGDSDERGSGERDTSGDTDDTPDETDEDTDEDTADDGERPSPSPAEGESPDDGSGSASDDDSDGSGETADASPDSGEADADAGDATV